MKHRRRDLLHRSKLNDFAQYLMMNGWTCSDAKGTYEVLRARHPDYTRPLIVYSRLKGDHFTVYDFGVDLVKNYVESIKENKQEERTKIERLTRANEILREALEYYIKFWGNVEQFCEDNCEKHPEFGYTINHCSECDAITSLIYALEQAKKAMERG